MIPRSIRHRGRMTIRTLICTASLAAAFMMAGCNTQTQSGGAANEKQSSKAQQTETLPESGPQCRALEQDLSNLDLVEACAEERGKFVQRDPAKRAAWIAALRSINPLSVSTAGVSEQRLVIQGQDACGYVGDANGATYVMGVFSTPKYHVTPAEATRILTAAEEHLCA